MQQSLFTGAALVALLTTGCDSRGAEAVDHDELPAAATLGGEPAPETAASASADEDVIRNVRVRPSTTTVEITFTSLPGTFATVAIAPTPPRRVDLPEILAREAGKASILMVDPTTQLAGYLVRSRTSTYVLNTAQAQPEEGSSAVGEGLRPGTTYHFLISAPARVPEPGEDEDELGIGAQYAGTFTTTR